MNAPLPKREHPLTPTASALRMVPSALRDDVDDAAHAPAPRGEEAGGAPAGVDAVERALSGWARARCLRLQPSRRRSR